MTDREVKLTVEQVQRYELVQAALDGRITNAQAATALGVSERQVQNLKAKVRDQGPSGLLHGNSGREPHNKYPETLRARIIELATTHYAEFNFSHLADMLEEEHRLHLSDETLRLWLRPLGHGAPPRRARQHRRRRKRKAREGELLFLDGSPHHWFGSDRPDVCMLLCSDDATGKALWGKFQPVEDRDGCFEVCHHVFQRHGLPLGFYLDCGSQFTTTRHGGLHVRQGPECQETHFQRAMGQLGVGLIFAHSPQARGRGERLNGSFQGRLVAELNHHRITDCAEATRFLNRHFIPRYNKRFARPPADPHSAWRSAPHCMDLRDVLCACFTRTVSNDNTISFEGHGYQLRPPRGCGHLVKAKIHVRQWYDGSLHLWHERFGTIEAHRIEALPNLTRESTQGRPRTQTGRSDT